MKSLEPRPGRRFAVLGILFVVVPLVLISLSENLLALHEIREVKDQEERLDIEFPSVDSVGVTPTTPGAPESTLPMLKMPTKDEPSQPSGFLESVDGERMRRFETRRLANLRHDSERRLGLIPRGLTGVSAIVLLFYFWIVTLILVLRAERSREDRTTRPPVSLRAFLSWFGLGFIAPIATVIIYVVWDAWISPGESPEWLGRLIFGLFWVQLVHAMAGTVALRGRRLPTLLFATALIVIMAVMTVFCHLFVMNDLRGMS
jgi:hypothetical protein